MHEEIAAFYQNQTWTIGFVSHISHSSTKFVKCIPSRNAGFANRIPLPSTGSLTVLPPAQDWVMAKHFPQSFIPYKAGLSISFLRKL
jgi:hypothetical protein